jgi:hypothetical protein
MLPGFAREPLHFLEHPFECFRSRSGRELFDRLYKPIVALLFLPLIHGFRETVGVERNEVSRFQRHTHFFHCVIPELQSLSNTFAVSKATYAATASNR